MDTASYSVSFWTTPLGAGALVDSAAGNRGTELANFGTFSLGGAMPETLTLSGPAFNYNPTAGNLLMQVQVDSLTFAEPYQSFFQVDVTGASTSRFFDYGAAVPEPGAWALMLVGLGGLGAALRSRRKPAGAVAA